MSDRLKCAIIALIVIAVAAAVFLVWIPLNSLQRAVTNTILMGALLIALILQFWPRLAQTAAATVGEPPTAATTATAATTGCDRYRACVAWLLALGGGAVVVFVLVWVLVSFSGASANSNTAIALPLIVMVGVIVLLIAVSLVTFTFSVLGLASPAEALGLPDGSVRAVIALMLLVLFSIVSIYLYSSVAAPKFFEHVNEDGLKEMRAHFSVVIPQPEGSTGLYKVAYRDTTSAGDDIAKQLIVLLGTLVTAVASFYFGANSVASANAAALGPKTEIGPKSTGISPNPIKPSGEAQKLTLTGSNLGKITKLHLEQKGDTDIDAEQVAATDTVVTAEVKIPTGKKGTWNVVVDDGAKSVTIAHLEVKDSG
jgi:hypothetical protein